MKTFIFAATFLASLLVAENVAFAAESTITLNFKSVMLTSQENGAAMIDLSGEIKKQAASTKLAGQRIKSVEVDGQASFLGATVILLISNQAVDSMSVDAGTTTPLILNSAYPRSPGAWALGIRGQMSVSQIKITIDDEDTKAPIVPLDPLVRNDPNTQTGSGSQTTIDNGPAVVVVPTTPTTDQQTVNQDLLPGETVIAVSSSSGMIDYVTIVSDDGGSYTVDYGGREIPEWTRDQLAKTTGCNGDLCVGNVLNRLGDTLTIVGILPGDKFVMQKSNQKYLVVNRSNLAATPPRPTTPATPAPVKPAPPAPRPAGPTRVGRYQVGQRAYLVLDAQHVYSATINAIRPNGSVDLAMADGSSRNVTRADQIAVISGCNSDGLCVGDQIQTVAGNGRYYSGRIIGMQSNDYAVLSIQGMNGMVGYWPFQSLEK